MKLDKNDATKTKQFLLTFDNFTTVKQNKQKVQRRIQIEQSFTFFIKPNKNEAALNFVLHWKFLFQFL